MTSINQYQQATAVTLGLISATGATVCVCSAAAAATARLAAFGRVLWNKVAETVSPDPQTNQTVLPMFDPNRTSHLVGAGVSLAKAAIVAGGVAGAAGLAADQIKDPSRSLVYDCAEPAIRLLAHQVAKIKVEGVCAKKTGEGIILAIAPHTSFAEAVALAVALANQAGKPQVCFLVSGHLFEVNLVGTFFKSIGLIPVPRGSDQAKASAEALAEAVKNGACGCIFPEGARGRSNQREVLTVDGQPADSALFGFRPGFTAAAKKAGVPIQLVTVQVPDEIWPATNSFPTIVGPTSKKPTLHLHFGTVLLPEDITDESPIFATAAVKKAAIADLTQNGYRTADIPAVLGSSGNPPKWWHPALNQLVKEMRTAQEAKQSWTIDDANRRAHSVFEKIKNTFINEIIENRLAPAHDHIHGHTKTFTEAVDSALNTAQFHPQLTQDLRTALTAASEDSDAWISATDRAFQKEQATFIGVCNPFLADGAGKTVVKSKL